MSNFNFNVSKKDSQKKLIHLLTDKFSYKTEEDWIIEINSNSNSISINHQISFPEYVLQENDSIQFKRNIIEPQINTNYKILYEDEYLFCIDKPSDLPVHPAGRYQENNLTTLLSKAGIISKYIINRIDRETSGIVLFAKNSDIAKFLGKEFEEHRVLKKYITYVYGKFQFELNAEGFLSSDENSKIRKKKKFSLEKSNRNCNTKFQLLEYKNNISKVLAIPLTGRIHQIRATLYSLGFPLVGDKIYGLDENNFLEFIETGISKLEFGMSRQALHATSLSFTHPISKKELLVESFEPLDMQNIFILNSND